MGGTIHKFRTGSALFRFPKKWANAVVSWLAGVHSPNGTIQVKNTLNPTDDGSVGLDINEDVVFSLVAQRLDRRGLTRSDIKKARLLLDILLDGNSVGRNGETYSVNPDWVKNIVADVLKNGRGGPEEEKGVSVSNAKVYMNTYLAADGYTHGDKVFITIKNGLVTGFDNQGDVQIYADGGGGAV
jgi:hypothetical protein